MAVITGKAVRLTLDDEDFWIDLTSARIEGEEIDSPTFAEIESGARQFFLRGTARQNTALDSLWSYVWDHSGTVNVPFIFGPHGAVVGTADKPVATGTLTIGNKPNFGGDTNAKATFDLEFEIDGIPEIDRGVAGP